MNKNDDMKNLGIIGGTFDPIHLGHLGCADAALQAFALDQVWFVPAYISNFKQNQKTADAYARMKMCELAIADFNNPKFKTCDIELKRQGVSYTSDTITQIKNAQTQTNLYFITGTDAVFELEDWHNYQDILNAAMIIAVSRKGNFAPSKKQNKFLENHSDKIKILQADIIECSSSDIHNRIKTGLDVGEFLTPSVASYIKHNKLYL